MIIKAAPQHYKPVKTECEISTGWARAYPALFTDKVLSFQTDYPASEFRHSIDFSRDGFITLTAERK